MITRLEIENFKAIKHLVIDLDPLTVLVGPNDSGKSTILQALDLLSELAFRDCRERFDELQLLVPDRDGARSMRIAADGSVGDDGGYRVEVELAAANGAVHLSRARVAPRAGTPLALTEDDLRRVPLSSHRTEGPYATILRDLVSGLVALSPHALARPCAANAEFGVDGGGFAALLLQMRTDVDQTPIDAVVEELRRMSKFVTGVGVDAQKTAGMVEARFAISSGRRGVPAQHVSTGVLLAAAYLALLHGTGNARFLIEEPENGVHPRTMLLIVDALRQFSVQGRQVVMTTHSPILLNYIDAANIRIVTRTEAAGVTATPALESRVFNELNQKVDFGELWYSLGDESLAAT